MKKLFTLLCLCTLCIGSVWAGDYVKVTSAPEDWSGEYLLVYEESETAGKAWNGESGTNKYVNVTISGGKITTLPEGIVTITIASINDGYSIYSECDANTGYIYGTSGSNALGFSKETKLNTIALDEDGVSITSNTSVLRYNNANTNGQLFRYYKSTSYSNQQPIQLYKKVEGTTPTKELVSIAVSGTPTKTEYYAGEEFDPVGLTVTGTYDDASTDEITKDIVWSVDPETLSLGTTSVSVIAKVEDLESEPYNVNVTVTEKPALPSYTLVTDASTLKDGDAIVLGAVKDDTWYVNGGRTDTNKYLDSKVATCTNDVLESSEAVEITLEETTGGWYLKIGEEYINTTAAKALTFADEASTVWTIEIDEDRLATVKAGDYGRFLYNAQSPRFLNYTSATNASSLLPYIFKKETAPASVDVTISEAGWATAYLPFKAEITSENATAYYVISADGSALTKVEAGVIPAGTGVLLKSNNEGAATVTFTETAKTATDATGNLMKGSLTETKFEEPGYTYYILANGEKGLGFYYQGADNNTGASVTCGAGKAVLAIQKTNGAKSFLSLFDEDVTGIEAIRSVNENEYENIYNLNGVRVNENYKGIVIINGKKVLK